MSRISRDLSLFDMWLGLVVRYEIVDPFGLAKNMASIASGPNREPITTQNGRDKPRFFAMS
ncbi:hypothetical protein [Parahaliea mediterranea]|uniref:Uncharacterized protein n=1 Tax=Parahaliea mediterranea TaxID=651086 RepID=A0A939IP34_9GAMM|nr:hypothetical protein [Parahaliea mediterranea]MBN7799185.1 hypothetical protein [Parahaliea mediterranea]